MSDLIEGGLILLSAISLSITLLLILTLLLEVHFLLLCTYLCPSFKVWLRFHFNQKAFSRNPKMRCVKQRKWETGWYRRTWLISSSCWKDDLLPFPPKNPLKWRSSWIPQTVLRFPNQGSWAPSHPCLPLSCPAGWVPGAEGGREEYQMWRNSPGLPGWDSGHDVSSGCGRGGRPRARVPPRLHRIPTCPQEGAA